MKFHKPTADVFVPDGTPIARALGRTTHMGIGAHQDDLEIMAYHGILTCFGSPDKWFTGVTVTNGSGSPRDDLYASYTDEQMMQVRRVEQQKAAYVGEYSAMAMLDFTSSETKDPASDAVVNDLKTLLVAARPSVVYTHNLADKHDTHVSVALRVISALRDMPASDRPEKVYGCEVWRALEWLNDEDKQVLDVSAHENLAAAVLGVFDSQICGGKRYDLATIGRRRANATYLASHGTDEAQSVSYAMDLTPLVQDPSLDPASFIDEYIERFKADVVNRLSKFGKVATCCK